jgi:positive regulator of sigma E activity
VILGMRDETVLAVSVFAYLVPLAGFMAGGLAGDALSRTLDNSSEIGAIMGAVAGMAVGLAIFRRTTNGAAQARQQIVLLRKEPTGIGTVSLC